MSLVFVLMAVFVLLAIFAAEVWINVSLLILAVLVVLLLVLGAVAFPRWSPTIQFIACPIVMNETERLTYFEKPHSVLDSTLLRLTAPTPIDIRLHLRNTALVLALFLVPAITIVFYAEHPDLLFLAMDPGASSLYWRVFFLCYVMGAIFIGLGYRWLWERRLLGLGFIRLAAVQSIVKGHAGRVIRYEFQDRESGFWGGTTHYFGRGPDPKIILLIVNSKNPDWSCPTASFVFHKFRLQQSFEGEPARSRAI